MSLVAWLSMALLVLSTSVVQAAEPEAPAPPPPQETAADRGGAPAYDATGRRDPFRPFILDIRPEAAHVQVTPLQRYDLGQLTVVATVWEVSPPRGMLQDSVGMGYIVSIGTLIGRNGGVVTAIEPERIVVEERTLDFYGKEQVNRIVLETPKDEGPNQSARERQ